ncbi:DegT/DnrJ/EryC1/StrS family aminotransferase [Catenuloplanes atrovinosus]|uniref:dTDP-4-amino-4,6-dideoxygalactose transaminase n=1 Tax=Catenuloplanes atrovinosus TaxID=137266 RepID=A0AAE4C915_9ACTN|nr:DegT/DnrJ/EryC1/StrS family aminotransferase [Catenuloplanes atrovinosus]MDR7275578.1 dTDP-4-amino-4,6-dideoxygalactose transaminase [Catenuloplanes atrovinosus]
MATSSALAIAGGQPVIAEDVHVAWPDMDEADQRAVEQVLRGRVMAGPHAPQLRALEEEYAEFVGVRHCVATSSGTASLHASLAAVGVGPGDEVIIPAYTFSASAFAAMHQGATPVFCDVDPLTYNLDPNLIEPLIGPRTRAIMAVHIHGQPADMDEINAVAARHGVPVVEDNSQAHGVRYRGRMTGSLGQAAGASINWSKNLGVGEGGLFTTDDDEGALVARRLVLYGEDVPAGAPRPYWSHGVGYNFRGQEMVCAVGRTRLRRLPEHNARAQANAARLTAGLTGIKGLRLPYVAPDRESSYWRYQLQVCPEDIGFDGDPRDLRDRIMRGLTAEGLEVLVWQPQPVPAQPAFRRRAQVWQPRTDAERLRPWDPARFPVASRLCDVSLSLGTWLRPLAVQEPSLMDRYVEAVEKVMADLDTLLSIPIDPYPRMTDTDRR